LDLRDSSTLTAQTERTPPASLTLPPSRGKGISRAVIVETARSWIGTPYQHQASRKGVGCDCLGLIRGVWRDLHGEEPEAPPPYRPDWAESGSREVLLEAARRHLVEIPLAAARPGDVLLFRMSPEACLKHCAIVSAPRAGDPQPRMIHAYWGRAVVESWLGPWWRWRLAHAFFFPGVRD
jgi:NlpC/P60 family putative phage cell wall peptidase